MTTNATTPVMNSVAVPANGAPIAAPPKGPLPQVGEIDQKSGSVEETLSERARAVPLKRLNIVRGFGRVVAVKSQKEKAKG